jgi:hypothetical protein
LGRKGVVVAVDVGYNLAFLGVGVWGNSEVWAFDGGMDGFGGWCAREWDGRWVDEGDGGGCKLGSDWFRSDGGLNVVEGGVGFSGGRHVEVV